MNRMKLVEQNSSNARANELLDQTRKQLGKVPNLYRAMANAPAALDGYLSFRGALLKGVLEEKMRERIALLVAQENSCEYCVSAHTFRGSRLGISSEELLRNRDASSEDARVAAGLRFVRQLVASHGAVSDEEFGAARQAGWSDEELSEMVAHVAINLFSNYFNHLAQPELDFPRTALAAKDA